MLRVGLIGFGTVGASVADILEKNSELIHARAGKAIVCKKAVVRDLSKNRNTKMPLTKNANDILEDDEIDIIVEVMGGVDEALDIAKRAMENGKGVVTANKALLAYHRYELEEFSKKYKVPFMYEASVAGGIPIIKALRDGLSANHIDSIKGIINGTCNYILTKMNNGEGSFDSVLSEAQSLGYAETPPTLDIGGFDAAHKILILGSIAYGAKSKPEDILIDGISDINEHDMRFAKEFGYTIKHIGIAKKVSGGVSIRVHAAMIPTNTLLAKVDGVMNAVSVVGGSVGETLYYGAGAGGNATASAIISDLVEIARGNNSPMLGFHMPFEEKLKVVSPSEITTKYYIRALVKDEKGVLATIANTLAKDGISIEAFLQTAGDENTWVQLTTHEVSQKCIDSALEDLQKNDCVINKPIIIRIEE